MAKFEVTITRTLTQTTKYEIEVDDTVQSVSLEDVAILAEQEFQKIINGEDPNDPPRTADQFEWEIEDDTCEVGNPDEDIEEL